MGMVKYLMGDEFAYDWFVAKRITEKREYTFYPCLIAAMAQADTTNLAILKDAFPQVYESWQTNRKLALQVKVGDWREGKVWKGTGEEDDYRDDE